MDNKDYIPRSEIENGGKGKLIPKERYTLTLCHEYCDSNGKVHRLESPVVSVVNICDVTYNMRYHCVNEIVHMLFDSLMRHLELK